MCNRSSRRSDGDAKNYLPSSLFISSSALTATTLLTARRQVGFRHSHYMISPQCLLTVLSAGSLLLICLTVAIFSGSQRAFHNNGHKLSSGCPTNVTVMTVITLWRHLQGQLRFCLCGSWNIIPALYQWTPNEYEDKRSSAFETMNKCWVHSDRVPCMQLHCDWNILLFWIFFTSSKMLDLM